MNSKAAVAWVTAWISAAAGAADLGAIPPTAMPYGSLAPVDLSQRDIADGNSILYRPWFDSITLEGDLLAQGVTASGAVSSTPDWSAKDLLDARSYSTRKVFKGNSSYGCENAGASNLVKYVCGDDSNEVAQGGSFHDRSAKLGTLIHSNPVYVGAPRFAYNFDGYLSFRAAHLGRAGRIYAGANDGMLHAFDTGGTELFGYIPDLVDSAGELSAWASGTDHRYFVDGPLVVADAYHSSFTTSSKWQTLLLGGLGAGGQGYFALDVTTPVTGSDSVATAAGKRLWEFAPSGIGYTYGAPLVARTNRSGDNWSLIAANGYRQGGEPVLYIRDLYDPTTVQKDFDALDNTVYTGTGGNGLSSPAAIDVDGDYRVDYAYAGDLEGNLWRFDLTGSDATSWSASKLFSARDGSGNTQPILAKPELALLSGGDVMVYFGTADPYGLTVSGATQSFYAVKDSHSGAGYARANLQPRSLGATSNSNYLTVDESASPNDVAVDWTSQHGWYLDLAADQHLLQPPVLHDSRIQFMVHDLAGGDNWLVHLEYLDGRLPDDVVFDLNGDDALSAVYDNIDYVDGTDPGDLVIGMRISADLSSGPTLAEKGGNALTYLNLWDEGMAGSAGTTTTVTTYADASCSVMTLSRIRVRDDKSLVTFTFTGHTAAGEIQAAIDVDPFQKDDNARSPGLGAYPASAGAGSGVNTTSGEPESWFGLELEVLADTVGSNDTRLQVTYNGPYRVNGFTLDSSSGIYELQNEDAYSIKTCEYPGYDYAAKACTGTPSCNANSNDIKYSSDQSSVSYSGKTWSDLNASRSYTPTTTDTVTTGATAATAASGTPDSQLQNGFGGSTGRLRWRELQFQ